MDNYQTQPKAGGAYEIPKGHKFEEPGYKGAILVTGTIRYGYYPIRVLYRAYDGGLDELLDEMSDADLREVVKKHKENHDDCFNVTLHKVDASDDTYSGITVYSGYPVKDHVVFTAGHSPNETAEEKEALVDNRLPGCPNTDLKCPCNSCTVSERVMRQ